MIKIAKMIDMVKAEKVIPQKVKESIEEIYKSNAIINYRKI